MAGSDYVIGRLLSSSVSSFVAGCRVHEEEIPEFGALVKVGLGDKLVIYGIIYDISIVDDGVVRQLATAENVHPAAIADQRTNRNVPMEMSIATLGYKREAVSHLLPPRPALSLDVISLCSADEVVEFTGASFGYLRHLLRNIELPVSNLLAAHVQQAAEAHAAMGNDAWGRAAAEELIILLRDDYPVLMDVLGVLGDTSVLE